MKTDLSRRDLLRGTGAALAAGAVGLNSRSAEAAPKPSKSEPFRYSLNTSTIRGQKLSIVDEIQIAAKAGYHAIEPWIGELDEYVKSGGSLRDLEKRIRDSGLTVESSIGFAEWIVDDPARRARGLEEAKRSMALVRQIGGTRIAAPPVGATDRADLDLLRAAERFRALADLGEQMGVMPQVEVWGFSKTLHRVGSAAMVAMESGHPGACVLADVYHLYRGGSDFTGIRLLDGAAMHVFHVNDYPAEPPRAQITDAHRVYPGDGVAPLTPLFRDLYAAGFRGVISLELFNPEYWKQDALQVAKTGLAKTRAAVRRSFA